MEPDFKGWATKAGLKCSDGRTIMPDAFKHQDSMTVPLVWQHGHNDPENVLGHVKLTNKPEGVYAEGFFNSTSKAEHAQKALEHGDYNSLSIWANQLIERSKSVYHGVIREVSLVLSGANPGALIEHVTIRHSDGDETVLDDEAIIFTGLELEHGDVDDPVSHAKGDEDEDEDEETVQDVYNSMSEKQKQVLHYMIGEALEAAKDGEVAQSAIDLDDDSTVEDVYESMTDAQKQVLHYMVGEALESSDDNDDDDDTVDHKNDSKGNKMRHNVFEKAADKGTPDHVLSHADVEGIVADATKGGSLREAVENYAISHGIEDIDILFPEAKTIGTNTPEFLQRRTEWVNQLLQGVRKSPFSRIKTMSADITHDEARAKGYIKGNLKKEEFFGVSKRVTTPTTIYKKQKLDRDDIIDITDFDVVTWLKGEMRVMLDEELARAILVGDGRDFADDDKISETNIRPVAKDHELYTTTVNVNIDDADSNAMEIIDRIIENRHYYKGTGLPTMYTTEVYISQFMLARDTVGRRLYKTLDEVASELRVREIVPVEVLEEDDTLVCILFNPQDYVLGADQGGNVSMFDDFDIDYNQHKYLIETRVSGALTKLKSAMVVRKVAAALVEVAPAEPAFDGEAITIVDQTGVVYRNAADDTVMNALGSPYAVPAGTTTVVEASPAAGYFFPTSEDDTWSFTNPA